MRAFYVEGEYLAGCGVYLQQNDTSTRARWADIGPDHRSRGIGQEVLAKLYAGEGAGSHPCLFECAMGGTGERFLRAAGARCVVADTERQLVLASVRSPALRTRCWPRLFSTSADYELVTWVGATPEELLDDVAGLPGRMSTDPPLDDLSWEPETYDAARVVARDRMMAAHGMRVYDWRAVAGPDDRRDRHPGRVLRRPRIRRPVGDDRAAGAPGGTALGALLKVANLRQAVKHEPDLEAVHTWMPTPTRRCSPSTWRWGSRRRRVGRVGARDLACNAMRGGNS